jgi:hypothetical protein
MAKKRMIDSRIRKSISFAALSHRQRDLWHGLITVADDQGRVLGLAANVRSEVWPFDDVTLEDVAKDLQALSDQGMIVIYQVKNKPVIQLVNWWVYQQKQWAVRSDWPGPEGWVDRARYHGKGHVVITENWDQAGGFEQGVGYTNQVENQPENQVENQPGLYDNDSDNESDNEDQEDREQPGQDAPAKALPINLDGWQKLLKEEENKPAVLRTMVEVLFPRLAEYPDFGYLGKVARQVGGAGRLGSLLWETSAKNVQGDVLAYIQAMTKARTKQDEPAGFEGLREYAEEQALEVADGQ